VTCLDRSQQLHAIDARHAHVRNDDLELPTGELREGRHGVPTRALAAPVGG